MARVYIDLSVVGQAWFAEIVKDLLQSKGVRFAYSDHPLMADELNRSRKMLQILQLAGKLNKRDDVPSVDCEVHVRSLSENQAWVTEESCDDPHIFAINYVKPVSYVFTQDTRIAKCRDCINQKINARYVGFRLVTSMNNYEQNRHLIHSP